MTKPNEQLIDVERIRERLESAPLLIAKFGTDGEKTVAYQSMDDVRALLEENKHWKQCFMDANADWARTGNELGDVRTELEQVKVERDFYKNVRDPHETILSLHTELEAKDKVLGRSDQEIESAINLLREDYFENWDSATESLSSVRSVIRSILQSYPPREKGADNERD